MIEVNSRGQRAIFRAEFPLPLAKNFTSLGYQSKYFLSLFASLKGI